MGRKTKKTRKMAMSPEEIRAYAEELWRKQEIETNPYLRKINENMLAKQGNVIKMGLICPICGENNGNTLNKKPYCFKCRRELVEASKVGDYKKQPRIKILPKKTNYTFS